MINEPIVVQLSRLQDKVHQDLPGRRRVTALRKGERMGTITVELDDKVIFQLMLLAHEKDITFNQLVNDILRECMEKEKENAAIV